MHWLRAATSDGLSEGMSHSLEYLMDANVSRVPRLFELVEGRRHLASDALMPTTADIVLRHGRLFTGAATVPVDERGPRGRCYVNSLLAALALQQDKEGWSYCEGFAYVPKYDALFEHAWLVSRHGTVLETTWPSVAGCLYLGVTFPTQVVLQAMQEEPGGMLFGDYARDFRLHREHTNCCAT